MKLIIAVIKPSRLDAVLDAVTEAGASGLTVTEVRGYGRQRGKTEVYRGAEYEVKLLPKVKLEIAVSSDIVDAVVEAITLSANTNKIGDGKIFVLDLERALRIRTGETDAAAITGLVFPPLHGEGQRAIGAQGGELAIKLLARLWPPRPDRFAVFPSPLREENQRVGFVFTSPNRSPVAGASRPVTLRLSRNSAVSARQFSIGWRGSMARAGLPSASDMQASILRPRSSQRVVKSRRVQRWMLGVDHQGSGRAPVSGIRPRDNSAQRTFQWPKFGTETTACSATRNNSDSTWRGSRICCRVLDRMA